MLGIVASRVPFLPGAHIAYAVRLDDDVGWNLEHWIGVELGPPRCLVEVESRDNPIPRNSLDGAGSREVGKEFSRKKYIARETWRSSPSCGRRPASGLLINPSLHSRSPTCTRPRALPSQL